MGLFTSKAVEWRRRMQRDNGSRVEYNQLAATIGQPEAKKFLETVYDKWVNGFKYKIGDLAPATCAQFMKTERENFTNRMQYVNSLLPQTRDGTLATILNANLRDTDDYYSTKGAHDLTLRDLAIDQAANWVCGTYVPALPATRRLLERYIPRNPAHPGETGNPALGRTTQHLRKIFKRAVPDAAPYRINLMGGVKYPSTVGGSVALERIFGLTSGTNAWPAFGDGHWESIAMFYLVSIVHVQAFSDGNKRTGHLAFAIVLIKGTHYFKVPTTAKESELFRMNG